MPRQTTVIAGRYRLLRRIYSGHNAITYQARDERRGRVVALKLLRDAQDRTAVVQFRHERQLLGRLRQRHIVRLLDAGLDQGRSFLVTEWIEGSDLRSLIATQAPLPVARTLIILRDVLLGLAAVHRAGIVLCDLKPENVLIATDGRVVLIDFSIARERGEPSSTMPSTVLGTAAYLAPEVARGAAPTVQSDLYAAGVLLYELLTGRTPFVGDASEVLTQQVWASPPRPRTVNAHIPLALERVILRSLAKDPASRYHSAGTLRAVLLRHSQQKTTVLKQITAELPAAPERLARHSAPRQPARASERSVATNTPPPIEAWVATIGRSLRRWLSTAVGL